MGVDVPSHVASWVDRPGISARSVLVTILGDSIAPLGGTVWLADLFKLAAPFGYSERLIRTSLSRLAAEGWVESERVGRLSRYRLTPFAEAEFAGADRRIYRAPGSVNDGWDNEWVTVLTATAITADHGDYRVIDHLRWRGYGELARGLWGLPSVEPDADVDDLRLLFARLQLPVSPPIAVARFVDTERLAETGLFTDSFSVATPEGHYRDLLERHGRLTEVVQTDLSPGDALAIRTMVIHDLRRARLADPDLPADLLPENWVGHRAYELTAAIHAQVDEAAWEEVERVTGLSVEDADERLAARFRKKNEVGALSEDAVPPLHDRGDAPGG